jgi:hypothetical protein
MANCFVQKARGQASGTIRVKDDESEGNDSDVSSVKVRACLSAGKHAGMGRPVTTLE